MNQRTLTIPMDKEPHSMGGGSGGSDEYSVDPSMVARRDSPIDLSQLYQLGESTTGDTDRNFVHDIIELFLQLAPQIYETAQLALKDGDGLSLSSQN